MDKMVKAMSALVKEMVGELSIKYKFDKAEALEWIMPSVETTRGFNFDVALIQVVDTLVRDEPPMLFTPDYISARIQSSLGATEPPREEEDGVCSALTLVSETSNSDEESSSDTLEDLQASGASAGLHNPVVRKNKKRGDMMKCFKHGQRIRHTIDDHVICGIYDLSENEIVCIEETYRTLSAMAKAHFRQECPERRKKNTADGWKECEGEIDGKWIVAEDLFFG